MYIVNLWNKCDLIFPHLGKNHFIQTVIKSTLIENFPSHCLYTAPCKHIIPPSLLNTLPRQICSKLAAIHYSGALVAKLLCGYDFHCLSVSGLILSRLCCPSPWLHGKYSPVSPGHSVPAVGHKVSGGDSELVVLAGLYPSAAAPVAVQTAR